MANFNNYFKFLKEEASKRGLGKGEWMKLSGLNRTRYAEFERGCGLLKPASSGTKTRDVSADYFMKLIRGLNLSEARVQQKSGIRFTKEQKKEIGFQSFIKANEDWLRKLYHDPDVFKACKTVADLTKT